MLGNGTRGRRLPERNFTQLTTVSQTTSQDKTETQIKMSQRWEGHILTTAQRYMTLAIYFNFALPSGPLGC